MFPTILFASEPKTAELYLENLIKNNSFNPSYIYKIEPKEKTILIDQVREINSLVQIKSPEKRLICIYSFETATTEAQNAMLKLLEEKTANNQFVLVVNDIQKVLPTILSRSTVVDMFTENTAIEPELLNTITNALDNPSISLLGDSYFQPSTRDDASELLKKFIIVLQKKIKEGNMRAAALAKIAFDLLHKLESNNVNHQLSVDSLLLSIIRSK